MGEGERSRCRKAGGHRDPGDTGETGEPGDLEVRGGVVENGDTDPWMFLVSEDIVGGRAVVTTTFSELFRGGNKNTFLLRSSSR